MDNRRPSRSAFRGPLVVTGATGFLGKYLLPELQALNISAILLTKNPGVTSRQSSGQPVDLGDFVQLQKMARTIRPRVILHMAAKIPNRQRDDYDILQQVQQNVMNSLNLISAFSASLKHFVFLSTIDVYGPTVQLPIRENHPTTPMTMYGASKLSAEHLLRTYCQTRGIQLTILRLAQVYGAGEPAVKVIPNFIYHLLHGQRPMMYGRGEDRRDFIYVRDAIQGIIQALRHTQPGIFNLGTGSSHSIKETYQLLQQISGRRLRPRSVKRTGAISFQRLGIAKAKKEIHYRVHYSLAQGLRETFDQTSRAIGPTLFLDVDGPLLDTRRRHYASYTAGLAKLGLRPLKQQAYWQAKRRCLPEVRPSPEQSATIIRSYHRLIRQLIEKPAMLHLDRLQPGTIRALQALHQRYRIVLVSLRQHPDRLRAQLAALGVLDHVDCLHGVNAPGSPISAKASAIRQCEHFRPNALVVGDTELDIAVARQLGLPSIVVTNGIRGRSVLQPHRPSAIAPSLQNVAKIIPTLQQSN